MCTLYLSLFKVIINIEINSSHHEACGVISELLINIVHKINI